MTNFQRAHDTPSPPPRSQLWDYIWLYCSLLVYTDNLLGMAHTHAHICHFLMHLQLATKHWQVHESCLYIIIDNYNHIEMVNLNISMTGIWQPPPLPLTNDRYPLGCWDCTVVTVMPINMKFNHIVPDEMIIL